MDLSEPRQFGPYLLLDLIAVGGMAEIYLAKTHGVAGFEKFLALKLIHPNYADDDQFVEMLIEEAKIAVSLNHVNIAQVFDLGRHEGRYYISMEFVDGADLFKVMRSLSEKGIDVPIDVAAFVVQELCTGLDYAHRKRDPQGQPLSIVHRDISPQNVLLSTSGDIKIVDFGIAKAASRTLRTQAGVIKGKYFYMSPEQAWGDPIDHRTDVFSAGIILYEILTGQMLYLEEDMHRLLDMVRKAEIAPPTQRRVDIPRELEHVVMKALAKHPEDRFQSAQEFQVALTNFLFSYASDFTPDRVAELVRTALEESDEEEQQEEEEEAEEATRAEPIVPDVRPAYAQLPRKPGHETSRVKVENLMSRADYRPDDQKSVLFQLDSSVDESDRGDATMISRPPVFEDPPHGGSLHGHHGDALAPPPAFVDDGIDPHELGAWDGQSDPTVIGDGSRAADDETLEATLLPEHPAAGEKTTVDGMMPAPPEQTPPQEVVIPRQPRGDLIAATDDEETYVGGADGRSSRARRPSRLGLQAAEAKRKAAGRWSPAVPDSSELEEKTWPVDSREHARRKQQPSRPLPRAPLPPPPPPDDSGPSDPTQIAREPAAPARAKSASREAPRPALPPPAAAAAPPAPAPVVPAPPAPPPVVPAPPVAAVAPPAVSEAHAPTMMAAAAPVPSPPAPAQPSWAGQAPAGQAPAGYAQQQAYAQPGYAQQPYPQQQQGHAFAPTPPQPHAAVARGAPPVHNAQTWPPHENTPSHPGIAWQPALAQSGQWSQTPVNMPAHGAQTDPMAGASPEQLGLESDAQRARRRRRRAVMATLVSILLLASAGAIVLFAFWPFDKGEARIDVVSVPLGGEIWLDGKNTGLKTQASVVVDPNKPHIVEVRLANYKTDRKTVRFPDGQSQVRVVALLTANYGKLDVNSKPEGADVIVNGEHRGNTPLVIEGLSLRENINLELRKRGYKPVTRKLDWDHRTFIKQVITLKRRR